MNLVAIIYAAAKAAGVSGPLLLAICTHETGLKNTVNPMDGGSPSIGICQVKKATAIQMGLKEKSENLMNPEINAMYAARFLRYQLNRYHGNWHQAVAAFNAGTYNESKKVRGCARNLKYVRNVQKRLYPILALLLNCGEVKVAKR